MSLYCTRYQLPKYALCALLSMSISFFVSWCKKITCVLHNSFLTFLFLKIYLTFPVKYPYYIVVFDLLKKGYTKMIHIRLASKEDIQNIMPLYTYARKFMAANGNPHQWNGNYPASEDILKDIANGNYYVCTPENAPEKIVGGFAFIIGREPNYAVIENGAWHSLISLTARFTGLPPTARSKASPCRFALLPSQNQLSANRYACRQPANAKGHRQLWLPLLRNYPCCRRHTKKCL